jgi:hypothetical protein
MVIFSAAFAMDMQAHIAGIDLPEIDDIDFGGWLSDPLYG